MLKGQAKKNYQRRYMREYRHRKGDVRPPEMPDADLSGVMLGELWLKEYTVRHEIIMPEPDTVPSVTTTDAPNSYKIIDNTPMVTGIVGYDADGNLALDPSVRPIVQPKPELTVGSIRDVPYTVVVVELDADGNPVYEGE